MKEVNTLNFVFHAEELPRKLLQVVQKTPTGSWQFIVSDPKAPEPVLAIWYLTLIEKRVVYVGTEALSWETLIKVLQRYLFPLHKTRIQKAIKILEEESTPEQLLDLGVMLNRMERVKLLDQTLATKALQMQILDSFDQFLFTTAGEGKFVSEQKLITKAQIPSFKLEDLLTRATQRRIQWHKLRQDIASMQYCPILNEKVVADSSLSPDQRNHIEQLMTQGRTLAEIAHNLAKDNLEIAKVFYKLVRGGVVSLHPDTSILEKHKKPEILVVDDSPILLEQFQNLVTRWGYEVHKCMNALNAVDDMLRIKPALIFLDINMPGATGFDLIKQMRRQPDLASLPVVLLTAENSLSNKWRAQWANCKFLAKPRKKEEITEFKTHLQQLLQELVPLPSDIIS